MGIKLNQEGDFPAFLAGLATDIALLIGSWPLENTLVRRLPRLLRGVFGAAKDLPHDVSGQSGLSCILDSLRAFTGEL